EIEPAIGVKGSQIVSLMKDLARALSVVSIRVVETIPGKSCMGLELPNPRRQLVRLVELLSSAAYNDLPSPLSLALGKDIAGKPVIVDLARMPHLLVAGTTGSGKSVALNAMILSLLYKAEPRQVRLILIDPKMLELSVYEGIAHPLAHRVPGREQDRFAHYPRPDGSRDSAGAGRHALFAARYRASAARPRSIRVRRRGAPRGRASQGSGRPAISRRHSRRRRERR